MPSSLKVGAEVQIQHLNQAKASSGSGSAFGSSEDRAYTEGAGVKRLAVANPDPPSPSSSSSLSSFGRDRFQICTRVQICPLVFALSLRVRRADSECSEALARSKPLFHPRNSPHPQEGDVSDDLYSLRSILEDKPAPASSASSPSARSPSPSPQAASGPQREHKPQAQAPSTAYTSMPLPTKDTAGRKIVIYLSNHGPGPKIIPQKDGVFIRTKYAVEIASVQFGSGSYTDTRPCSNAPASTFVSSLRAAAGATNSSSSFSEISSSRSSTSTLSASIESDCTATNEIAGLDISKVKPAYFYGVLRAGTHAMQRSASRESDSAQRRRRRKRRVKATESDRS
ncbi:predicted protein [Aspergillus nidulans FGSC A4]|uniref:Uncharacterized protein n=1 Tax=Emericella nidulans (strain FGSC A4 / ATCC 38163 / CBS 112.46 / NRRL 194 / M139) TaxID=227321 RepID=Q5AUN9_EMENI|nr:hypothetical protein [Aspergillus nidulans FGSC A4]EAA58794.1 predicted protein [Aspergillus nidulans FGSC A4]CBF73663.1 TPA: hypothetical protein ANIA_07991 [Aspergillus nidulans FGSC A4]|eukprot:XP_681260.1 predicted protein [Aspergillus nidulans FGSC A4]